MRKLFIIGMILCTGVFMGGCGSQPNQMEANRYAEDGYLGMVNSNPNFHMNPTHYTYRKDRQLMMQALRSIGMDKRATIFMNGAYVTVTIQMDGLDPAEREAIRYDVHQALENNVPRYDYTIVFR